MNHEAFIVQQLKRYREERGIPIAELARRVEMTPEMLGRSLREARDLKADELVRLCVALDVPLRALVPDEVARSVIKASAKSTASNAKEGGRL